MSERSQSSWRRWSVMLPAIVLFAAVAVQAVDVFRETPKPRPAHLARLLPDAMPGWTMRSLPLGANEFVSKEAEKILNYDEVLNREYSRSGLSFGVYVAYWGPGKMPTRLVASHTPDRCWTENGWRCLAMKYKQTFRLDGQALQPAEWRQFEPPSGGKPTYVLFWHLVDGRVYDYGERLNSIPDPIRWSKDAMKQAFVGCSEQYFIRITSSEPAEKLWQDPEFVNVMRDLVRLGLTRDKPTGIAK